MIEIQAIDHIVLRTRDIKSMLEFYCDVLNCDIERELPELGLVQLRAGEALIDLIPVDSELGRAGGKAPSQDGRNLDHLCLRIRRFAKSELNAYLRSKNIQPPEFAERYGAEGFGESVYINDPEDNIIELKFESTAN